LVELVEEVLSDVNGGVLARSAANEDGEEFSLCISLRNVKSAQFIYLLLIILVWSVRIKDYTDYT